MANKKVEMVACEAKGKAVFNVGSRIILSPAQASTRVYCLINGDEEGEYILTGKAEFKNGEIFSVDSEAASVGIKAGFLQAVDQQPEEDANPAATRKKRKRTTPKVDPPEIDERPLPTIDPPETEVVA